MNNKLVSCLRVVAPLESELLDVIVHKSLIVNQKIGSCVLEENLLRSDFLFLCSALCFYFFSLIWNIMGQEMSSVEMKNRHERIIAHGSGRQ